MTKTIEFIEEEIKLLEDMINMDLALVEDDFDLQQIRKKRNKLQTLRQIECELEAWEICKNKLNLKVQTEEAVTEGFCMKGYWLLVEQYPYTQTTIIEQEEYEILKKSLEVEDE